MTVPDAAVRRLLSQAFLFDDPASYEAGVRDVLDLLAREVGAHDTSAQKVA